MPEAKEMQVMIGQLQEIYCDEIVNNSLMEIATGESSRFQCLELDDEIGLLQSVGCRLATH